VLEQGLAQEDVMADERLHQQLNFILEIDKLKQVLRQNHVLDGTRRENTAEHSWHLAMLGLVLADRSGEPIDRARVIEMLLLHDIVEIDAGDTFAYDTAGHDDKAAKETAAATRLFGLLPDDLGERLRGVWDEFEAGKSPESRLARGLDRLQPILLNRYGGGHSWRKHGIRRDQVLTRNIEIKALAPELWALVERLTEEAVDEGLLLP
jgi:putative hydrolases of HD superfamily